MLHRLYWDLAGPALRALGPVATFRLAPRAGRLAGRLRSSIGVAEGLRLGFPEADDAFVRRVQHEDAARQARTALERHALPLLTREALDQVAEVHGAELLRRGPAIVVQAHFGVHGLPGVSLGLHGVPLTIHATMVPDAELAGGRGGSQARRRELEGRIQAVRYLHAVGEEGVRGGRAVLDRGEVLLAVPDGFTSLTLTPGAPRVLPLLGRPVRWPTYAFTLAKQAGVPLCAMFPDSRGQRTRIDVVPLSSQDPQAEFVARYDAFLRQAPGQWQYWAHYRPGELLA